MIGNVRFIKKFQNLPEVFLAFFAQMIEDLGRQRAYPLAFLFFAVHRTKGVLAPPPPAVSAKLLRAQTKKIDQKFFIMGAALPAPHAVDLNQYVPDFEFLQND